MAIIQKVQSGDTEAFSELIRLYQVKLYSFLLRLTSNREDAEELLQDTFMKVYRNLSKFDGRAAFNTWLYHIALNIFKTYKKRSRIKQVSYEDLEQDLILSDSVSLESPNTLLEKKELRSDIQRLMGFLKHEQKAALVLKYMQGFSYYEVGKVLGISEEAAKMKVFRARKEILNRFSHWER